MQPIRPSNQAGVKIFHPHNVLPKRAALLDNRAMAIDFDYIIVGAGASGCVLAERLTANGRHRVLVLEAGGFDNRFYINMPLGYGKTYYDKSLNWMYYAEPDAGLNGQVDYWPRGKVLGGSSSINAMVYARGAASDFDDWRRAGNIGWGWDDVLAAYREIEDNEAGENEYRGRGGPLFISANNTERHWLGKPFEAAAQAAGLPHNDDFNGATQEGVGHFQLTVKGGQRNSAARAFLRPAMKRKNIEVITNAQVLRVVLEGTRACGVEYLHQGRRRLVRTNAEVILAGGAVNSPQLLQLSGIGPGGVLNSLGIDVVVNNPNVGRHLQDHIGVNYTYQVNVPTMNDALRPWWGKLKFGLQYLLQKRGPLTISINQGGGFFRSSQKRSRPNMQLYFQAFSTLIPKAGERPLLNPDPFSGMSLGLSNCRPTSRGEIIIKSSDPLLHPRIIANALSTAHDVKEMLEAVKFIRHIAEQPQLAQYIVDELRPGPEVQSDTALVDDFRKRSGTVYHPCSTCRMAPNPANGVVDSELRVHGIRGLRVVDASAFPSIISGNLNAPAIMLAWKAAGIILRA